MSCVGDCNIGRMRHRIKFQRLSFVQDSIGGQTETYTTYFETWADVKPVKAREKWQADQLSMRITHKIKCRFFTGIKGDDRIIFKGRNLQVQEIINVDEVDRFYEIMANEGDAS